MRRWLPPTPDFLLALVLLVATQAEIWTAGLPGSVPPVSAALAVGALALAARRTAPLTSTAVSLTGSMVVPSLSGQEAATTLGWLVVALVACASCGYYSRARAAGLLIVLGLPALALVIEHGPAPGEVLFGWILAGGAWYAGRALSAQVALTRLAREHAALTEERTALRAEAAVADERIRIAREMHDVVAHGMSVMMLHVGGVRRLLRPDQEQERAALADAETAGREATAEMHRILGVLRDDTEAGPVCSPSLRRLDELLATARAGGLVVELWEEGEPRTLPRGVDQAAFRIVQEALTNVRRHASAGRVTVRIGYGRDRLDLEVCDDGVGQQDPVPGGHGLAGMRERATAYGGSLRVGRGPDGGFLVAATLPLDSTAADLRSP